MPEQHKLTLNLNDVHNDALSEVVSDLMITKTEYQRRLIGLGSLLHKLVEESADGQVRFMIIGEEGQLEQRHVVNDLQF